MKFTVAIAMCLALIAVVSANYRPFVQHPRLRRSAENVPQVETEKHAKPVGDDLKTDSTFWYHYRTPAVVEPIVYSYPDTYYYNYWWY